MRHAPNLFPALARINGRRSYRLLSGLPGLLPFPPLALRFRLFALRFMVGFVWVGRSRAQGSAHSRVHPPLDFLGREGFV